MRVICFTIAVGLLIVAPPAGAGNAVGSISKWTGSYESVTGSCGTVVIEESKITWGSCKDANIKVISVRSRELVMAVDPSAVQCGWAGFIVGLEKDSVAAPGIIISAYQSLDDHKAKNRYVECAFKKAQSGK
ncbi:MAG TPA: hypothetical protein VFX02_10655 [Gammaproteobacteria bacterium]|nr:hypothetical protein [Gammaproteobacteria bacterium]